MYAVMISLLDVLEVDEKIASGSKISQGVFIPEQESLDSGTHTFVPIFPVRAKGLRDVPCSSSALYHDTIN
jgi:hypothetical protein